MDDQPSSWPAVAYLGPPSTYTHQATVESFDPSRYQFEPCPAIIDVFHAVQDGLASYGVVPFENSSNGAVVQTLDIFGDRQSPFLDVYVCGEAYIAVHHCLLGYVDSNAEDGDPESGEATPTRRIPTPTKPKVKPRKRVQHIRKIYSHPQAFGQCEAFLSVHLKSAERQEVSSTSKAAQLVSEDSARTSAAISSRMAAEVHGLDVLAAGIEDRPDNETRFLILKRGPAMPAAVDLLAPMFLNPAPDGDAAKWWKSLVSFTINQAETGALSRVLNLFKDFELNLTSINSRPTRLRPWQYTFFVEFDGRKEVSVAGRVGDALDELKRITETSKWHGSWRKRGASL